MLINLTIIGTFTQFNANDDLIELKDAGSALQSSLGNFAMYVWALGLFSSGQSATLAGALTGQYIMEGFLTLHISRSHRILLSRLLTLMPCILIAKYAQVEAVYIALNIVQFVQLPFVLIPLFKFIDNETVMGGRYISKTHIDILKKVSVFFVIMNLGQVMSSITVQFNLIVVILVLLSVYILLLWRLWTRKLIITTRSFELTDGLSVDC